MIQFLCNEKYYEKLFSEMEESIDASELAGVEGELAMLVLVDGLDRDYIPDTMIAKAPIPICLAFATYLNKKNEGDEEVWYSVYGENEKLKKVEDIY